MYQLTNATVTIDANVPTGTTLYSPSGTTIKMLDDSNNQDNCENSVVSLGFSSN
jgi:YbbR domain-containing protein